MAATHSIVSSRLRGDELPAVTEFATRLLAWFDEHGRKDLPWQVKDPYRVWISEIMLQQTQVQTVIPYYERFIDRFPTIDALADAPLDDVLHHWSGLGYYARARNLHGAACRIKEEFGGQFPATRKEIESLPGIGRSTAGAILSLAFDQRQPILDGNVKRVLARHAAIDGWPGTTAVAARLWELAERYTPQSRVADYTQAIMDLGATLCTRSKPRCTACPLRADCIALARDEVSQYPASKPRKVRPLKKTTMVLAVSGSSVLLRKRPPTGIWGGLWGLPELADEHPRDWCAREVGVAIEAEQSWDVLRHSFSHYDLDIHPVLLRLCGREQRVADGDDAVWYLLGDTPPGGIAAPVRKLLDLLEGTHQKDFANVANG